MTRMADKELYEYRLEYYAALGHADDKIAKRKLERLRDLQAKRRLSQAKSAPVSNQSNKHNDTASPSLNTGIGPSNISSPSLAISRSKPKRQFETTHINKRTPL